MADHGPCGISWYNIYSVLQCVAVCCSVLQCVAVCDLDDGCDLDYIYVLYHDPP